MSLPEVTEHDCAEVVQSASVILDQVARHFGVELERSEIRRQIEDTYHAQSIEVSLIEAAEALGFRSRKLVCLSSQIRGLLTGGMVVILIHEEQLSALLWQNGEILMVAPTRNRSESALSNDELMALMNEHEVNNELSALILSPLTDVVPKEEYSGNHQTPWKRFVQILRPEWSDIWIVLIFASVSGILTLATPIAVESLVNTVAFGRFLQPVVVLSLLLCGFLAFSAASFALQSFVVEIIQRRMFARVSADLAYRIPRIPHHVAQSRDLRELVNRFFDVVTLQKVTASLLLDGVSLVLSTLVGMIVIAFYHPFLLGFDVVLIALISFIVFVLGRGAIATAIKESKTKYRTAAWFEELASRPTSFLERGTEEFALEKTDQLIHDYLVARKLHFRILFRQILFMLGLQVVASTVLLGLGGWLVIEGQLTLGQLVAAELIVTVIVSSFAKLGKHLESFYDLLAGIDKLGNLFDLPVEEKQGVLINPPSQPAHVRIVDLSYKTDLKHQLFKDLNVDIPPGSVTAITGASGSGKTVFLDHMASYRRPVSGKILVDDWNLHDLRAESISDRICYVNSLEIICASILDNIRIGRWGISLQQVHQQLSAIGMHSRIDQLPDGLETKLDHSGRPLTENELRKIMILRSLVQNPGVILIDGLLDTMTFSEAEKIIAGINKQDYAPTIVFSTVRSDLIDLADQQVLLPHGEIQQVS
ncbi:peptidase domain-containing ABC transporter [Calycomorphotria hydatis]|uniref:Alpha-hemolysin translocation ATP-binding protein HlyB n=1 Tax=Calycomorphotria hydatis TaxID=2528027 RepID=A0A517T649_9PLAN|nr:ATP-binding cassette domain-containing protein [Calycomorphotria hydatis]QDT63856.1 Alpha-hemolysin translocation ATP-binding protein HlyB [Calycomorphotria hydatis]